MKPSSNGGIPLNGKKVARAATGGYGEVRFPKKSSEHAEEMDCRKFIETLVSFLSGELPEEERKQADLHLKVCPACVRYLKSYEVTIRLGKDAFSGEQTDESLPEDLVDVILSAQPRKK